MTRDCLASGSQFSQFSNNEIIAYDLILSDFK